MLIILTTHPIQYQVPIWQALARDGRVPFEVWYLTRHGVNASHDVEFNKEFTWDIEMLAGYPHRFLEVMPGATPNTFWKCRLRESLAERLRASGAKALWVQGWQVAAYWQAVWAAKSAGVEVWLRGESNDLAPVPSLKRALKRVLLGQLFRRVDRFLCIGTANKRLYQKFGVPAEKLHPAPYAVDNERFRQQADALRGRRTEIRRQWGIADDAFCVLFCGKFIAKKRPLDVVKAARVLIDENPAGGSKRPVHLLFVGSGELGEELRTACRVVFDAEKSASDSTSAALHSALPPASFAGFLNQTEISQAYVAADCLVLPSDFGETWGLVVNEAMASGLPCVISDRCGCAEDLGRLSFNQDYPCGDTQALAKRLVKFQQSPQRAAATVVEVGAFSFCQTVETVGALYEKRRDAGNIPKI